MSRRRSSQHEAPGQDSFLDIVSNLVGILIILVMVIGVQARNAMVQAQPREQEVEEPEADPELSRQQANSLQDEINQLYAQMNQQQLEVAYRAKERDRILMLITAAEQHLEQERSQLDEAGHAEFDVTAEISQQQQELEDLRRRMQAVQNSDSPTEVIKHIPTPMAKTVFGQEIHFRLMDNRLVYVPLQDLIEKFQREARQNAWKLKNAPTYTDLVGPVRGFHLKYHLKRITINTGGGYQDRVELDHFDVIPNEEQLGESVDAALRPDSEFRAIVSGFDSNRTTITIWVYPDSFGSFRRIKEELFQQGYLTASRPLPFGRYISGSPQGTRSAAQ